MQAAYLFGKVARRKVGLGGNHVSLSPGEVRCSDVHRMEPESEREYRSVNNITQSAFTPRSNNFVLLLSGGERALEKANHKRKRLLKAQVVL